MLGLNRGSQYASWWNQGGPLVINITAPGAVSQSIYQTPSYSWQWSSTTQTIGSYPTTAYVDLNGFETLPNTNNRRWTMFSTFQLNWSSGLAPGPGNYIFGFMQNAKFVQGSFYPNTNFWGLNTFVQLRDDKFNVTGRMETDYTINRVTGDLPGTYEDYNNRWLTFIYAGAESSSEFANWRSYPTGYGYYSRGCLYDTETRELLQTLDLAFNQTGGFPEFVQFANQTNSLYFDLSGDPSTTLGISEGIQLSNEAGSGYEPMRLAQQWGAFGTCFDPANPPDSTVFTTRPNDQIGNAVAWYNTSFSEYTSSGSQYFVKDTTDSLYNEPSDLMINLGYDATEFAAGLSTTDIPKDQS